MQLRDYQVEAVASIWKYFETNNGNPLIAMPTGTGKSLIIASFLQQVFQYFPNQKILMITHVKELIEQNAKKLLQLWPTAPLGIYSAGLKRKDKETQITFCGIASIAKRAAEFGHVDLVLIDEAHLVSPSQETMYHKFLADLAKINPLLKIIGLTATPWRLGQGHLTEDGIFTDVCFDITGLHAFNRLIAEGHLAPLVAKNTKFALDTEGLHMRGGEFIPAELQQAVDRDDITEMALQEAIELGKDRKHWLIFCSGVDHALNVCAALNDKDIPCTSVYSGMSDEERKEAIEGFKSGKYRAMTNNNILTTGFDFPEIDFIPVLRPTASTVLWVQMLGRGTRPAQGKQNCLVLDFSGNTQRLGPINDPVLPRKKGSKEGTAPVKLCEQCDTWNHASVRECTVCSSAFHFKTKLKSTASNEKLIKGELPIIDVFKVTHITYEQHTKQATGNKSLRVAYHCGLQRFTEYVCIEYSGGARAKAERWWRERSEAKVCPSTVDNALLIIDTLKRPTHLRVWTNQKYPSIIAQCFDGTAFGTVLQSDTVLEEAPDVVVSKPLDPTSWDDFDGNISF